MQTRFPPEPNGYLHIGHAKAISVDYELAREFGGHCNLRFDDTNPDTEEASFVDGIIDDLRWLGYEPGEPLYASDYFEQLYQWAELMINDGKAYVDDQDGDTIRAQRGGYGKPGVESPCRDRSVEENLDLFRRMRAGEFADGSRVLRAKIDMQAREHAAARPGDVPHQARPPPPHGRDMGDLSHLRLGTRPERRHRGRHPLALHTRVRQPSGSLRLVPRAVADPVRTTAPDRVRRGSSSPTP